MRTEPTKKAPSEVGGACRRACHVISARNVLHRPTEVGHGLAAADNVSVAHDGLDIMTLGAGKQLG